MPNGPVPLAAAFAVPRALPSLALAWTDLLARLELRSNGFERRVLRRRFASYTAIERVDAALIRGRAHVTLILHGRFLAFVAVLRDPAVAARLVQRFAEEGCPVGEGASRLLGGDCSQ